MSAQISAPAAPTAEHGRSPVRSRRLIVPMGALALLLALAALHLATGTQQLGIFEVAAALLTSREVDSLHHQIVVDIRLPRTLVAATAGGMLALAGALLQSVLRNPLAAPSVLGVSSGAVLLAALAVTFGPPVGTLGPVLPLLALVGGLGAGLAVYTLGRHRGRTDPTRLILVGVLLSGIAASATAAVVIVGGSSVSGVLRWMIGSINGRVWHDWHVLWPWALVTIPLALATARVGNLLQIGDEAAAAVGLPVERARLLLVLLAAMLTAGAVAIVGAVAFVGLIVPHAVRGLVGADTRRVFPLSLVAGAALLLAADAVVSTVRVELPGDPLSPPALLPVGVLTAFLGGAFFAVVLLRRPHQSGVS